MSITTEKSLNAERINKHSTLKIIDRMLSQLQYSLCRSDLLTSSKVSAHLE